EVLRDVDLVLDTLGEPAYEGNLRVLRRGGRMSNITVDVPAHVERYGPTLSLLTLGAAMVRLHVAPWLRKRIRVRHVIKRCDGEQLGAIMDLCERGAIRPTIDSTFSLDDVAAAHAKSESHRARGKIAIRIP